MEIVGNILKTVEESDIVNGQVVIPEGVSIIGILAFQKLDKITSVVFPKSLRTIEELAFTECTSLEEVNLNEGLAKIKYAAFSNCTSLRKVKMTDSVLSMEGNTFRGCDNLEEAHLSENLSTIDAYTFHECRKLTTINFPKALERIEEEAFAGCSALKEVKLPENVTSIEHGAFSDSTNTQYIVAGNLNDLFVSHNKPLTPIYRDERRIITEHDKEIRDYTVNKIKNIRVNIDEVKDDFVLKNKKNKSIYLGEDWYVMLKKGESGNIHILDIARTNPTLEDEKGIQLKEIIHTIFSLIKKGKIEAYLKGDRIIKLYQINKKLGYIEPILEETKEEEVHVIFKEGPNFSHKEPVKVKTI